MSALLALALAAQVTPSKLPPANPLPPPVGEETGVMVPINALLSALGRSDSAGVLAATRPEGGATVALERDGGARAVRHLTWAQFAAQLKPGGDRFEERLIGTPAVEIDGDIAMVWADYLALTNGKVAHCGVDHFDLVREGGTWRVLNVTWSQRTGCAAG